MLALYLHVSADDWVYLPDDRERQEYVMNEEGTVYTGTSHYIGSQPWIFGQVSTRVLPYLASILKVTQN